MAKRVDTAQANPFVFFILCLPYGISTGFVSVTLPFLLIQHGFSVGAAASITALGLSANLYRFLWAPVTDLTFSLHKWYLIGLALCSISLACLIFPPLEIKSQVILTIVVFISQIASTIVVSPVGGFMAKTVADDKKGRAGGWYQAGNLGGMGIGGGAGIWLSTHFSYHIAIGIIALAMLVCAFGLYFVPQTLSEKNVSIKVKLKAMTIDVKELFESPVAIYTMVLILMPIGSGAAAYIWSSVGNNWHVTPDRVAVVTGLLSGIFTALGCVFGGWIADKVGNWWAFFGSGTLMACVTIAMCVFAFTPFTYTTGVLFYAFMSGFANAAFSAVVLFAIGKGLAATKYALLSSIGNVAPVYMTWLDGQVYSNYHIKGMLYAESIIGIVFVVIMIFVLWTIRSKFTKKSSEADTITNTFLNV